MARAGVSGPLKILLLAAAGLAALPAADAEEPAHSVRILSPVQRGHVHGVVTVEVEAQSPRGIREVRLTRDGSFLETTATAPYRVEWDTRREAEGPHNLLAKAVDGAGAEISSDLVTVTVDNTPPAVRLTKPARQATAMGVTVLEADASDILGISEVRFLVDGNLAGLAKSPPYRFSWDSSAVSNGVHVVEAAAYDQAGNSSISEFAEIRVSNRNRPPVISPIGPKNVREGEALDFRVVAYDPDGPKDPVTFRAVNLPAWASFNSKTGEFHAVPTPDAATLEEPEKVYRVRIQACDPEPLCSSEEVPITVQHVNRPPVLKPIPDQKIWELESVTIVLDALDPDNDPLVYSTTLLPQWMKFNPSTHTLSGTPDLDVASHAEQRVSYRITAKVCDPEKLCDEKNFTVTVLDKNSAPVFKRTPDISVPEGRTVSFMVQATDVDEDRLTLSTSRLPEGAAFLDNEDGTGTFAWTIRLDQAGEYPITFVADDGQAKATQTVTISVEEISLSISGRILDADGKGWRARQVSRGGTDFYRGPAVPGNDLVKTI